MPGTSENVAACGRMRRACAIAGVSVALAANNGKLSLNGVLKNRVVRWRRDGSECGVALHVGGRTDRKAMHVSNPTALSALIVRLSVMLRAFQGLLSIRCRTLACAAVSDLDAHARRGLDPAPRH